MGRFWTQKEDEILKQCYQLPDETLALRLGRTARSVLDRRRTLGIPSCNWEGVKKPEFRSAAEKEYRIRKLAAEMHVRLLG